MGWGSSTAQYAGREIGTPNRGTDEAQLDAWNQQLRASPLYQNFMRMRGLPTNGRVKLSRQQQSDLERELKRNGIQIPGGMHIDQGGNLNQKNRLGRNIAIGAAVAGAAFGGAAALGAFSGAGAAGGGAAGAAGAAGGAGAGAAGAAGTAGALAPLATTGWVAPMAAYAAPATSALGTGAAALGTAGAAGAGLAAGGSAPLAATPTATGLAAYPTAASVGYGGAAANGVTPAMAAAQAGTGAASGGGVMGALQNPYLQAGIQGGLSYLNGRMGANAARTASEQQLQAVREAMAYNDRLYTDARQTQHDAYARGQAGLAPYQGYGGAALTSLGSLMGYGNVSMPAPVGPLAPLAPLSGGPVSSGGEGAVPRAQMMPVEGLNAGVGGGTATPQTQSPQQTAQIQTSSAYTAPGRGSAGLVTLLAPDGSELAFPAGHPNIERALAMGAQVV